jgi:hypothetical protein
VKALTSRSEDKKTWITELQNEQSSAILYEGSSGNRAADVKDMAQVCVTAFDAGAKLEGVAKRSHDQKWGVWLEVNGKSADKPIEVFGSHANKAADLADAINKVIAGK